jgi:hypothetical protein
MNIRFLYRRQVVQIKIQIQIRLFGKINTTNKNKYSLRRLRKGNCRYQLSRRYKGKVIRKHILLYIQACVFINKV